MAMSKIKQSIKKEYSAFFEMLNHFNSLMTSVPSDLISKDQQIKELNSILETRVNNSAKK